MEKWFWLVQLAELVDPTLFPSHLTQAQHMSPMQYGKKTTLFGMSIMADQNEEGNYRSKQVALKGTWKAVPLW